MSSPNYRTLTAVPAGADVPLLPHSNATVTVNYQPTYRKGEYFRADYPFNNTTGAVWLSLTNLAVLQNGTNEDIVTNTLGNMFVPQSPEQFHYDTDGNLTNVSVTPSTSVRLSRRSHSMSAYDIYDQSGPDSRTKPP